MKRCCASLEVFATRNMCTFRNPEFRHDALIVTGATVKASVAFLVCVYFRYGCLTNPTAEDNVLRGEIVLPFSTRHCHDREQQMMLM